MVKETAKKKKAHNLPTNKSMREKERYIENLCLRKDRIAQALKPQKNINAKNFLVNRPILSGRIKMSCVLLIRHTLSIGSKKVKLLTKRRLIKQTLRVQVIGGRPLVCLQFAQP